MEHKTLQMSSGRFASAGILTLDISEISRHCIREIPRDDIISI